MPFAPLNGGKTSTTWWPGVILFCLAVVIGLLCYKDYGIAWDEPTQRGIGNVSYNYAFKGDQLLKTYEDRDLGTGFELPLIFLEKGLHLTDSRDIYLMRHIATHLFFLFGVFCGYLLALRLFKNQYVACLGFVMLAFTPRIYAHSFFNTKDIPFLSAFLIVFLVNEIAFDKNKRAWYLLSGLACGYATSIRAMGILLLPCISLFFLIDILRNFYLKEKVRPVIINFLLFTIGFCGLLYVAWPILWSAPLHYFTEEFKMLSHIFWVGDVLFEGTNIDGRNLPWDYLPVWFSITVPELWLLTGITGFLWAGISFLKKPLQFLLRTPERNFLLYLACFAGPVIAVTVLHSVNYDDWRHLYFIYPGFVMFALFAVDRLTKKTKLPIWILYVAQLCVVAVFVVKYHPFEQVYFNNLVSHKKEYLRKHYDLDYWGCAYKEGMEYILAHDSSAAPIKVYRALDPTLNAYRFLTAEQRKRIILTDTTEHPRYFITNFRNHPDDYNGMRNLYEIQVLNSTIMRVYKMHN